MAPNTSHFFTRSALAVSMACFFGFGFFTGALFGYRLVNGGKPQEELHQQPKIQKCTRYQQQPVDGRIAEFCGHEESVAVDHSARQPSALTDRQHSAAVGAALRALEAAGLVARLDTDKPVVWGNA